jgi:hypothetical protein
VPQEGRVVLAEARQPAAAGVAQHIVDLRQAGRYREGQGQGKDLGQGQDYRCQGRGGGGGGVGIGHHASLSTIALDLILLWRCHVTIRHDSLVNTNTQAANLE